MRSSRIRARSMQSTPIASITNELLAKAKHAFRPIEIKPGVTHIDEIMCSVGEQRVLEWLEAHKRSQEMIGDINATRLLR